MNKPADSARKELENFIQKNDSVTRPFNYTKDEPWTVTEQASWAIIQVKNALRFHGDGDFKEVKFDATDSFVDTDDSRFIGVSASGLEVPEVLKNPRLFKLTTKAFAEVAGVDPKDVTTCSAMRRGFLISAMNLISPPLCIAVANEDTAKRLIDFAVYEKLQSGLAETPMVFSRG